MEQRRGAPALTLGLLLVVGSVPLLAERGVLVLNVQDTQGTPIIGVEIGTKGDGGSAVTGKDGKARVPLAPATKEGAPACQ